MSDACTYACARLTFMLGECVTYRPLRGCGMASISTAIQAPATTRRKARLLAVGGAVLAALVVWGLAKLALGDLRQPAFGSARPQQVSAALVVVVGLIGSLLGWALLALLERLTSRSRRIWAIVAPLILLASLAAPVVPAGAPEPAGPREAPVTDQLRRALWDDAGVTRNAEGLERVRSSPALLPRLVAESALARRESRGGHFRSDFPTEDEAFEGHVLLRQGEQPVVERWS